MWVDPAGRTKKFGKAKVSNLKHTTVIDEKIIGLQVLGNSSKYKHLSTVPSTPLSLIC